MIVKDEILDKVSGEQDQLGLVYICGLFNMKNTVLADELGVSKQLLSMWFRQKRIMDNKYIPKLVEIFNIPANYFMKHLAVVDMLKIQKIKLINDCKKLNIRLEDL